MTAFSSQTNLSPDYHDIDNDNDNATSSFTNIYNNRQLIALLMEYPSLVEHEETKVHGISTSSTTYGSSAHAAGAGGGGCYKVQVWTSYLEQIDDMLHEITTVFPSIANVEKRVALGNSSSSKKARVRVGDHQRLARDMVQLRLWTGRRAVHYLPGSYKLWRNHLLFLLKHVPHRSRWIRASFRDCFKRLHKMPRLWMDCLKHQADTRNATCGNVTEWRRTVQQALTSLPVTQHAKIWTVVLEVLERAAAPDNNPRDCFIPSETTLRMLRRYCMLDPTYRWSFAKLCCSSNDDDNKDETKKSLDRPAEAALIYLDLLNDPTTPSQSKYKLWVSFSNLVCRYPQECRHVGIDLEALIRGAMLEQNQETLAINDDGGSRDTATTTDESLNDTSHSSNNINITDDNNNNNTYLGEMEGTLWAKLAEYYIRLGNFDMARSIYEEAMTRVSRVRDFSILFDAYTQLEEGMLEQAAESMQEDNDNNEQQQQEDDHYAMNVDKNDDEDWDILLGSNQNDDENHAAKTTTTTAAAAGHNESDIEFIMARAEHLTRRRPLLLNRVLLKQNPHNVGEWLTRSQLYVKQGQTNMAIATLVTSLTRVTKAVNGSPSQLILELVKLYEEEAKDVEKARRLLQQVCQEGSYRFFRHVDDLAACHAAWIELELRHEQWDDALSLARQAVAPPATGSSNLNATQQKMAKALPKSLRLWDLLLDLEESLGTVATTKDSYNRAMETKVATPLHILNYCSFLREKKYFEESFTAYERGVELFGFPASKILWKNYLEHFMERYKGTKVERTRDLFQRCLESCPPEDCAEFYLMNGAFEEQHGLTKRALGVYKQMCLKVPDDEKFTAYQLYIAKTTKYMGVAATRDVYQEAIAALTNDDATARLCLEFSRLESSLQELDRARGILSYGAQMADPRRLPEYWTAWHEFEVAHGSEESFRDMLRIKRSVQASFSTVNYNATDMGTTMDNLNPEEALEMIAQQEGVDLDDQQRRVIASREANPIHGFVSQKRQSAAAGLEDVEERVAKLRKAAAEEEEIDIDDLDEDDEDGDDDDDTKKQATATILNVSTKQVPDGVFGGLAAQVKKSY